MLTIKTKFTCRSWVICPITLITAWVLVTSGLSLAQVGKLTGHVIKREQDGSTMPAEDATVEVYKDDKPDEAPYKTKSGKGGKFSLMLPFKGTYIIVVSARNSRPSFLTEAKAGRGEDYELILMPGDGSRLTLSDVTQLKNQPEYNAGNDRSSEITNRGTAGSGIITKYDRFRDETSVSTSLVISKPKDARFADLGPIFSLYVLFVFSGQNKAGPPSVVSFGFNMTEFEGTRRILPQRFPNPSEFIVLYDGNRYKGAMSASRVRTADGYAIDSSLTSFLGRRSFL